MSAGRDDSPAFDGLGAGEVSAGAAPYPKPNAQYRVAFLSPDISPVRVQGGQRLVDRRSGRNTPARGSIFP